MTSPLVSIVVPAYNHAHFLTETLDSLTLQTYQNFEVIIIDDGSLDNTQEVVTDYIGRHRESNVSYHRQINAGAHAAINSGIRKAGGEFIAIINSDDLYAPERIEFLKAALDESGELMAFSAIEVIDDNSRLVPNDNDYTRLLLTKIAEIPSYRNVGYALLDFNVTISTGNLFFKRELFDRIGGFSNLRYCHDWDFVLSALEYTMPVHVAKPLYRYRLHDTNSFVEIGKDTGWIESAWLLRKFFRVACSGELTENHACPSQRAHGEYFDSFVLRHRLAHLLPEHTPLFNCRKSSEFVFNTFSSCADEKWRELIFDSVNGNTYASLPLPSYPVETLGQDKDYRAVSHAGHEYYQTVKYAFFRNFGRLINAKKDRLLQFGLELGEVVRFFSRDVYLDNLYGVDFNPALVGEAEARVGYGCFQTISEHPPSVFPSNYICCAYSPRAFIKMHPLVKSQWYGELARILKPRGLFVCTYPNGGANDDWGKHYGMVQDMEHPTESGVRIVVLRKIT